MTEHPIWTSDEARWAGLPGWNIRCNRCGSFGARWLVGERPGWGALCLCPTHEEELRTEQARHALALAELREVNFEQVRPPLKQPSAAEDRRRRKEAGLT